MIKLWGGPRARRAGLSAVAGSVLALGGVVLPGLASPAAADDVSDALAAQHTFPRSTGDDCVCGLIWSDFPFPSGWNEGHWRVLKDDSLWGAATQKRYEGSMPLVFGGDIFVADGSSSTVQPYVNTLVNGFQTRGICYLSTGSGAEMKPLFENIYLYYTREYPYPVKGGGRSFAIGAGRPSFPTGYPTFDGEGSGQNVGSAADYPVSLTLDAKTGDSAWAYTTGRLRSDQEEAVFVIASVARTPATVRYQALNMLDPVTGQLDRVCQEDVIGSSSFGNCAAMTVQHIRVVRPSVLVDDGVATTPGVPVPVDVLANDTLSAKAGAGSVMNVSTPAHGVLTVLGGGKFRYSPAAGYAGTDSFTYQVRDENLGVTRTATVKISVAASSSGGGTVPTDTSTAPTPTPVQTVSPAPTVAPSVAVSSGAVVDRPGTSLPRTGGDDAAGLVAVVGVAGAAVGGLALRRRRSR